MSKRKNKLLTKLKSALMHFLCHKKRTEFRKENVRSILILRYDRIGDMVVSTPLIAGLRRGYPDASISVLASQSNAQVIDNNPNVKHIHVMPSSFIRKIFLLMRLRRMKFSMVVELEHNLIWHMIAYTRWINPIWVASCFKSGRYGVNPSNLGMYDLIGNAAPDRTIAEMYLGILNVLGIPTSKKDLRYQLFPTRKNLEYAQNYLQGSFFVGLNICGGKQGWQVEHRDCVELCRMILEKRKDALILLFSTKAKYHSAKKIRDEVNHANLKTLEPTDDVMDAAAVISGLDLLISPDTSLIHIACGFSVPLVSIHPNSDVAFINWKPLHPTTKSAVVFSAKGKSLEGYSFDLLQQQVSKFI